MIQDVLVIAESPSTSVSMLLVAGLPLVLAITMSSSEAARLKIPSALVFLSLLVAAEPY